MIRMIVNVGALQPIFYLATDPEGLYNLVDRGGVLALLLLAMFLFVVGGFNGWYAFRPYVNELKTQLTEEKARNVKIQEDLEAWRAIAMEAAPTLAQQARRDIRPRRAGGGT